jgi:hypothetical protein
MVIRKGLYGKYVICPHAYTDEKCNQKFSI